MQYRFGSETFGSITKAQIGILSYILGELENYGLGEVVGSNKKRYDLELRVKLIPKAPRAKASKSKKSRQPFFWKCHKPSRIHAHFAQSTRGHLIRQNASI